MTRQDQLLIVDDELLIRDLLYDHFCSCDFAVSLADNGSVALEKSSQQQFDAVILDLKMPDLDGLEVATLLREQQADVPIIIITGYPSVDSAVVALRQRYADYFVKPFNIKKLEKAVHAAIEERHRDQRRAGEAESD